MIQDYLYIEGLLTESESSRLNTWIPPEDTPIYPKPKFQPEYLNGSNNDAGNAVLEIKSLWDYIIKDALHIYSFIYCQLSIPLSYELEQTCRKHRESFAVYDKVMNIWLFEPRELCYTYCYDGEDFVDFTDAKYETTGNRLLLVGKYSALMQESNLLMASAAVPSRFEEFIMPSVELYVGVPGCGKTTYIINHHRPGSLVLTSCAEGAQDIRKRMAEKCGGEPRDYRWSYRTIDSYLLNSRDMCSEVWVDEALMEHPGKLFMVCVFSACRRLCLLGDPNQLGYINRVNEVTLQYDKSAMFFKPTETLNVSYRCPVDVMAIISKNYAYDGGAHSASDLLRSLKTETFISLQAVPRSRDTKYLVFKQAEKKEMKARGYDVSTVHEFQGKQAARVALVRTSGDSREQLYQSAPHMLVALSRHTKSLVYYTPVNDALKQTIDVLFTDAELEKYRAVKPLENSQKFPPKISPIIAPLSCHFSQPTAVVSGNSHCPDPPRLDVGILNAENHDPLPPLSLVSSCVNPICTCPETGSCLNTDNSYHATGDQDNLGLKPNDDKLSMKYVIASALLLIMAIIFHGTSTVIVQDVV